MLWVRILLSLIDHSICHLLYWAPTSFSKDMEMMVPLWLDSFFVFEIQYMNTRYFSRECTKFLVNNTLTNSTEYDTWPAGMHNWTSSYKSQNLPPIIIISNSNHTPQIQCIAPVTNASLSTHKSSYNAVLCHFHPFSIILFPQKKVALDYTVLQDCYRSLHGNSRPKKASVRTA